MINLMLRVNVKGIFPKNCMTDWTGQEQQGYTLTDEGTDQPLLAKVHNFGKIGMGYKDYPTGWYRFNLSSCIQTNSL